MGKLFTCANRYIKECKWQDLAMLKFCLCSIGILIGICMPKRARKSAIFLASMVFVATYVPLMSKFLKIAIKDVNSNQKCPFIAISKFTGAVKGRLFCANFLNQFRNFIFAIYFIHTVKLVQIVV